MALMILAHPYFDLSVVNKTIIEALQQQDLSLEIRDIYHLYPNYQIDAVDEQKALLRHDLIILQYPMFWMNMPAILQTWFDTVFTHQFVNDLQDKNLKTKKILFSLTIGQIEHNFNVRNFFSFDIFLFLVQKSIKYAPINFLNPICLYNVSSMKENSKERIQEQAKKHSQKLIKIIRNL